MASHSSLQWPSLEAWGAEDCTAPSMCMSSWAGTECPPLASQHRRSTAAKVAYVPAPLVALKLSWPGRSSSPQNSPRPQVDDTGDSSWPSVHTRYLRDGLSKPGGQFRRSAHRRCGARGADLHLQHRGLASDGAGVGDPPDTAHASGAGRGVAVVDVRVVDGRPIAPAARDRARRRSRRRPPGPVARRHRSRRTPAPGSPPPWTARRRRGPPRPAQRGGPAGGRWTRPTGRPVGARTTAAPPRRQAGGDRGGSGQGSGAAEPWRMPATPVTTRTAPLPVTRRRSDPGRGVVGAPPSLALPWSPIRTGTYRRPRGGGSRWICPCHAPGPARRN